MDHTIHIHQSGKFIPIMHYNAVAVSAEITYINYNEVGWQGIIWTGGTTEVIWLKFQIINEIKLIIILTVTVENHKCPGGESNQQCIIKPYRFVFILSINIGM